jgi:hypothetical protein
MNAGYSKWFNDEAEKAGSGDWNQTRFVFLFWAITKNYYKRPKASAAMLTLTPWRSRHGCEFGLRLAVRSTMGR